MTYFQILFAALTAWLSGSGSISFDGYTLTVTNNGAPVKFTFASALAALEEFVASGETNLSFQVGSTKVDVVKN